MSNLDSLVLQSQAVQCLNCLPGMIRSLVVDKAIAKTLT